MPDTRPETERQPGRALGRWLQRLTLVALPVTVGFLAMAPYTASYPGAGESALPGWIFENQDGRKLQMDSLRGQVVVIVFGDRSAVSQHVQWGRRLDEELRRRGTYQAGDPDAMRAVRILAVAQMGGIPESFRPMLRSLLKPHVEPGYSLWLDWENRLRSAFGGADGLSTVVVADRSGAVRLVRSGPPEGATWQSVSDVLFRLP